MSDGSEPSELFQQGIKIRREVLGDAYVDKALAGVRSLEARLYHLRAVSTGQGR